MFCAPELVFDGTEGVRTRFNILRSRTHFRRTEGVGSYFHILPVRTHFRRYRGRWVSFPCFARPDSFSAVPRASGPIFMFCTSGLIFGGSDGVGSHFLVLRPRTYCRWYRGRRVPFSCLSCRTRFRRSDLVFMFCAPRLIFGGSEGFGSHFHPLRPRTHFRWYRGRYVPFLCLAF
jgi:hypothetical protein